MYRCHVMVCGGTGCTSSGSDKIIEGLRGRDRSPPAWKMRSRSSAPAASACARWAPSSIVYPEGSFYSMVKAEDVPEIVDEHLLKGRPVTRLLYEETVAEDNTVKSLDDTAFYKKQHAHRAAQLRRYQPREHRRVHRLRRLSGAGQGAH